MLGLTVILEPAEEGGFTSQVAEYPSAISEGQTELEAVNMALQALQESFDAERELKFADLPEGAILHSVTLGVVENASVIRTLSVDSLADSIRQPDAI